MKLPRFLTALSVSFMVGVALTQSAMAEQEKALPTEQSLKADLSAAQKIDDAEVKKSRINELQISLDLLQQIQNQQKNNDDLDSTLSRADAEIQKIIRICKS
ncbi:Uncharacterized MscS family protein HI_0195.1 precursor [Rodentibacter pneumotropicus]|uniref:Uncharacterized MscS family protein HI_0195.1 n=1 Tax=Rodentibacter pneumotropicus TaxID=758 RepID=A0A3S4UQV6_9PAST|nr:Uncharacterized MscS family protein HI_0195.1 precursor [Rodentibacter pneumotropicus]